MLSKIGQNISTRAGYQRKPAMASKDGQNISSSKGSKKNKKRKLPSLDLSVSCVALKECVVVISAQDRALAEKHKAKKQRYTTDSPHSRVLKRNEQLKPCHVVISVEDQELAKTKLNSGHSQNTPSRIQKSEFISGSTATKPSSVAGPSNKAQGSITCNSSYKKASSHLEQNITDEQSAATSSKNKPLKQVKSELISGSSATKHHLYAPYSEAGPLNEAQVCSSLHSFKHSILPSIHLVQNNAVKQSAVQPNESTKMVSDENLSRKEDSGYSVKSKQQTTSKPDKSKLISCLPDKNDVYCPPCNKTGLCTPLFEASLLSATHVYNTQSLEENIRYAVNHRRQTILKPTLTEAQPIKKATLVSAGNQSPIKDSRCPAKPSIQIGCSETIIKEIVKEVYVVNEKIDVKELYEKRIANLYSWPNYETFRKIFYEKFEECRLERKKERSKCRLNRIKVVKEQIKQYMAGKKEIKEERELWQRLRDKERQLKEKQTKLVTSDVDSATEHSRDSNLTMEHANDSDTDTDVGLFSDGDVANSED